MVFKYGYNCKMWKMCDFKIQGVVFIAEDYLKTARSMDPTTRESLSNCDHNSAYVLKELVQDNK